jgi:hypothetical protein
MSFMGPASLARWLDGRWLLALIAIEVLVALLLLVPRAEVGVAGAALGEYAAQLTAGHGYRMELPCGQLDRARRMPLEPLFLAAVSLFGGGLWAAVGVRLALSLALLVASISLLTPPIGPRWWRRPEWVGVLAVLAAAPAFAKHLAQTSYEEGFSIVLIPCTLLSGLAVLDTGPGGDRQRPRASIAFGGLLASVFLLKSGYAPFHLVGCAALAWAGWRWRQRSAQVGLLVALAAPIGWVAFSFHATGRPSLGTSWDGENLFRGWCEAGLRIYPWQSLDRLFDASAISTPSGPVSAPHVPTRCAFSSEWAWSDHYRDRALAWALAEPGSGALFMAKKALVVLLEVRPVPSLGTGGGALREVVVVASFVVLRGAALLALVLGWRRRAALANARPSLAFAAAACIALCAPLIVGFAYDRHSAVLLVAFLFVAAGISSRAETERRTEPTVPEVAGVPRAGLSDGVRPPRLR